MLVGCTRAKEECQKLLSKKEAPFGKQILGLPPHRASLDGDLPLKPAVSAPNANINTVTQEKQYSTDNAASVNLLLEFAREQALADEQERQRHLDNKAGTLAGFVAVALSLEAALGASVLTGDKLGCTTRGFFIAAFVVALVSLATAAWLAAEKVLAPKGYPALTTEVIRQLSSPAEMQKDPPTLAGRQLATVVNITVESRERNDGKARSLRWAFRALSVAVVAIAAQGLVLPFA